MWPFKSQPHTKRMVKVVLTDGKALVGEEGPNLFVGTSWIRHKRDGKWVLYPHCRVHRIVFWEERED